MAVTATDGRVVEVRGRRGWGLGAGAGGSKPQQVKARLVLRFTTGVSDVSSITPFVSSATASRNPRDFMGHKRHRN